MAWKARTLAYRQYISLWPPDKAVSITIIARHLSLQTEVVSEDAGPTVFAVADESREGCTTRRLHQRTMYQSQSSQFPLTALRAPARLVDCLLFTGVGSATTRIPQFPISCLGF